jgi:translation initiation factor 2 beta subunit (eIF-2beta)/eIF-5
MVKELNNFYQQFNIVPIEIVKEVKLKLCAWCNKSITPKMVIEKQVYYLQGEDIICPDCIKLIERESLWRKR